MTSIDGIAFTRGPGMPGCLSIGAVAARALAAALNKPLVGVHHMQAHALTALYTSQPAPKFPFLTLLVSGGHTLLLLARSRSDFTILATTDDESIGNAFDRVAKLLDVPWSNNHSAGASLERFAEGASSSNIHFSIPSPGKLVFSYSGLVSAVRSHILKRSDPNMVVRLPNLPPNPAVKHPPTPERELVRERMRITVVKMSLDERMNIAASFQKAAIGQLEEKLKLGLKKCMRLGVEPRSIVVSGGVASNSYLRASIPAPGKLAFSYSGLISAVRSHILKCSDPDMIVKLPDPPSNPAVKHPPTPERELVRERMRLTVARMSLDERKSIAASFQKAAIGQLEEKLKLGLKRCMQLGVNPGSIVVSGGVASNSYLRARLKSLVEDMETELKPTLVFPPPHLCTDNAVMIAWTSLERFMAQDHDKLDIRVRPVWSIEDLKAESSPVTMLNSIE
ncbi:unnamed protein product [Rhizoctonia solani]|uniref:N(6)-L-threonylcarbamoyladenine synthase n=1 Tax=Rhizoctonia solani TaxID=456999 RepID=A0A8H3A9X3_9AGAM|nr:unnamed protein product [Rhizoctonia solani]